MMAVYISTDQPLSLCVCVFALILLFCFVDNFAYMNQMPANFQPRFPTPIPAAAYQQAAPATYTASDLQQKTSDYLIQQANLQR